MKVLILYNKISKHPTIDELDVLEQVQLVEKALKKLDHKVKHAEFDLNIKKIVKRIKKIDPDIVFNLAESIYNKGEFAYLAPSILSYLNIPFTGSPLIPMFNSSNKLLSKRELSRISVPTPNYFTLDKLDGIDITKKYILKPVWEEGSLDLDEYSIFDGDNDNFTDLIILSRDKNYYFVEEFIEGREFNVSIIGTDDGPKVLPIAEMTFNYPEGKPKIMGFKSKWDENSFEYKNTKRTFDVPDEDLKTKIVEICKKCWNEIGFNGYVRIDFRIDSENNPYVIDLNLNPCISESGGFYAACKQDGYTYKTMIEQILKDALK